MGPCEQHADRWLDHLYGLLSDQESRELTDHVAQCPTCQATLAEACGDQTRMARAAHLIRSIPEFRLPAEEAAPTILRMPLAPAALLSRNQVRRSLAQRLWPVWVAAAALLLAIFGGTEMYRRGATARDELVADAKKQLHRVEDQIHALKAQADAERLTLLKQAKADTLRLFVVGASQAHADAPYACRIVTRNHDGQPAAAKLDVRLVRADTGDVVHRQALDSKGEVDVLIPAGLKLDKGIRLEVAAKNGTRQAEISEKLQLTPGDHVVHLCHNKSVYQLGEVAFFRALALERYSLKPPVQPVSLKFALVNAEGKKLLNIDASTGPGGIASGEFALISTLPPGGYTIQVAAADPKLTIQTQTRRVEIVEHLSDLEVRPEENKTYRAGDKVIMNLVARADDGNPLTNQQILVRPNLPNQPKVSAIPGFRAITDAAGKALAHFTIPKEYQGSRLNVIFEMRRVTKEGKSSYAKVERSIAITPSKLEVDFYPEGGDLVAGAPQRVYFRVHTPSGETAAPDSPLIVTSTKGVIFRSQPGQSLGSFTFTPDPLEIYTLKCATGNCIPESKDPFHKLAIQRDGVALHVPIGVAKEGEAVRVELRQAETERKLLVVATCRGQIVGQQFVESKNAELEFTLPAGVRGMVRLTAYEIREQRLVPLAERVVYRTPTKSLNIKTTDDLQAGKPGRVNVEARDENGNPIEAWALAVLVDGQYRAEHHEQSLAGHFLLASEFAADLADAPLLADDSPSTRKALELFLGTYGWRRFVPAAQTEPAQFAQERGPALFGAEGGGGSAVAVKQVNDGLQSLQARIDREQTRLEDERKDVAANVTAAVSARGDYSRMPSEYFRLGLGVLAALALLAAVLGMLFGLARIVRRQAATYPFAGAMSSLGVCVALYLGVGSIVPVIDIVPSGDARAELKPMPRIDVGQPEKVVPAPVAPLTGQVALAPVIRPDETKSARYAPDLTGAFAMAGAAVPTPASFTKHPQLQERFQAAEKMQQATPLVSPVYGRQFALQNPGADAQPTLFWHPDLRMEKGNATLAFDVPKGSASYRLLIYGHSADGRLGFFESEIPAKTK